MEGFSINPEDLPEELRRILEGLMQKSMLDSGLAHDEVAENVVPSTLQQQLEPGDYIAVTRSDDTVLDSELVIGQIVDPELHAEEFPDWRERLTGNYPMTHLLVRWYARGNEGPNLGWFPRSKLVRFEKEHWEELKEWIDGATPPQIAPAFVVTTYNEAVDSLWEANKDKSPKPIRCEECDSTGVVVKIVHHREDYAAFGMAPTDEVGTEHDPNRLHKLTPYGTTGYCKSWEICHDCGHERLQPDEIALFE